MATGPRVVRDDDRPVPVEAFSADDGGLRGVRDGGRCHPWVRVLAEALGRQGGRAGGIDALELAEGAFEVHPALAEVADVAHLTVVQALAAWAAATGVLRATIGPRLATFDPEADAVRLGLKPACLKEQVPAGDVAGLGRAYAALGLRSREVSRYRLEARRGDHVPGDEMSIVAVARDGATLDALASRQGALRRARDPRLVVEVGELMGYPPCCAEAFARLDDQGDNLGNERRPFVDHPGERVDRRLSRLGALRLVSHHLCSPSCAPSARLAAALVEAMASIDPEGARGLERALAAPVLFVDYRRRARLTGAWQGDRFALEHVESLEDDPGFSQALAGATALSVDPAGVVVHHPTGERRIDGSFPLLVVPGEPLAPAAQAALAPLRATARVTSQRPAPEARPTPVLPPALRPGARVMGFRVAEVRRAPDGLAIVLTGGDDTAVVRARQAHLARPGDLEVGPWAVRVEAREGLSPAIRAAIGLVLRALEAGGRAAR